MNPMFNGIARCNIPPDMIDSTIHDTIAYFRSHQTSFWFWWLGGSSQSRELSSHLEARGFIPYEFDAPGMAVDLHNLNEDVKTPEHFRITKVADEEMLRVWGHTFVTAYQVPEFAGQSWIDASLRLGVTQTPWQFYVGWLGDEPVSVSMLVVGGGVVGLLALATLPSARGQGIGSAMTLAPLRDGRAMGYRVGILFSTDMGFSVYSRLGFQQYTTISRYLWRA